MTDTPEVPANDIPAILARADAATQGEWYAVGKPWGEGDWVNAHSEDPHNGAMVCDCQMQYEAEGDLHNGVADADFIAHSRTDVPNMAAEILSLRAQLAEIAGWTHIPNTASLAQKRLDVLEEMLDHNDLIVHEDGTIYVVSEDGGDSEIFDTFTEAADAELLTRREKGNG